MLKYITLILHLLFHLSFLNQGNGKPSEIEKKFECFKMQQFLLIVWLLIASPRDGLKPLFNHAGVLMCVGN